MEKKRKPKKYDILLRAATLLPAPSKIPRQCWPKCREYSKTIPQFKVEVDTFVFEPTYLVKFKSNESHYDFRLYWNVLVIFLWNQFSHVCFFGKYIDHRWSQLLPSLPCGMILWESISYYFQDRRKIVSFIFPVSKSLTFFLITNQSTNLKL